MLPVHDGSGGRAQGGMLVRTGGPISGSLGPFSASGSGGGGGRDGTAIAPVAFGGGGTLVLRGGEEVACACSFAICSALSACVWSSSSCPAAVPSSLCTSST